MVSALVNKMFAPTLCVFLFFIPFVYLSFAKLFLSRLKRGKKTHLLQGNNGQKHPFGKELVLQNERRKAGGKTLGEVVGPNFFGSFSKQTDLIYLVHHECNETSCFRSFYPLESDSRLVGELPVSVIAKQRL